MAGEGRWRRICSNTTRWSSARLRGVVRDALKRAAREGLKSAHHFYIGFATQHARASSSRSICAPATRTR